MIYVAGPFFNPKERMHLNEMIEWIKREYPNEELFIPMEHFIPNDANLPQYRMGYNRQDDKDCI